ncbi:MAG: hypothetical protein IJK83_08280 [Clostridiales bacterium]|nr:hypothetical protein [Clostridiales bacterium]
MRNNKKIVVVILSLLMSAMLISCQKETPVLPVETGIPDQTTEVSSVDTQTESTSVHQDEIVNSFPESFNSQIGNCQFSIDNIDSPRDVVFHPGTACNTDADYLGLAEELMKGEEYTVFEATGEIYVEEESGRYKYAVDPIGTIDFIYYAIPYSDSVWLDYESENYNLTAFQTPHTFDFGTPEECYAKISDLFAKYGLDITTDVNVEVYYLDHETLASEEYITDHDGNIDRSKYKEGGWNEHDDAYMFLVSQNCQGLSVAFQESWYWPDWFHSSSNAGLIIIYNEDGIQVIRPRMQICQYKLDESTEKLLTFDEMAECAAEYLSGRGGESVSYQITKAKLYVMHGFSEKFADQAIEPHWAFYVIENDNGKTKEFVLHMNAITGEYETK